MLRHYIPSTPHPHPSTHTHTHPSAHAHPPTPTPTRTAPHPHPYTHLRPLVIGLVVAVPAMAGRVRHDHKEPRAPRPRQPCCGVQRGQQVLRRIPPALGAQPLNLHSTAQPGVESQGLKGGICRRNHLCRRQLNTPKARVTAHRQTQPTYMLTPTLHLSTMSLNIGTWV